MKIVAIADLHYEERTAARVKAVARAACSAEADALVLGGDCAARGGDDVQAALALFAGFDGPRLMVPGNHDLWEDGPPFATRRLYEKTLPALAREHGFHYLDDGPLVLDDVAFVGCIGWYDYAMRQREAPQQGITVTPIRTEAGDEQSPKFSAVPGAGEASWDELGPDDYAANGLVWQTDGAPHVAVWNDALHMDWGRPAPAMAEHFAGVLRGQIEEVRGRAQRVVAVTHFVPFVELAEHHRESPRRAFARAYLGSPLLGEALLTADDLALVIYGHRHRQDVQDVRGVVTADASIAEQDVGPLLLTLPD